MHLSVSPRRLESDKVRRTVADDSEGNQHGAAHGHAVPHPRLGSVLCVGRDLRSHHVFGRLQRLVRQFHVRPEHLPDAVAAKRKSTRGARDEIPNNCLQNSRCRKYTESVQIFIWNVYTDNTCIRCSEKRVFR